MTKEYKIEGVSIPMAIVDAIPVLLFGGSGILLALMLKSPLCLVGAIAVTLSGAGKVVWKMCMAIGGKNLFWLSRQQRWLMPSGFAVMLVAAVINHKRISLGGVWKAVTGFPVCILLLLGVFGMVLMGVFAMKLDSSKARTNWIEQITNCLAQLSIFFAVMLLWVASGSYKTQPEADKYLKSSGEVTVRELSDALFFDGPGTEKALIFYPGALVEHTAYAPIMYELAKEGVDCFIVQMPCNLAIFGSKKAAKILKDYGYAEWYIGGHSLGGVMASNFAMKNADTFKGILLLASYPATDLSKTDLKILSLYGSEDKVLSSEKFTEAQTLMPKDYTEIRIDGGNHAGFGCYGAQKGDGEASISQLSQWETTVKSALIWLGEWKYED